MTTINVAALHGHHPLGYLAACGLFRVVSEKFEDCRLSWIRSESDNSWTASIHCETSPNVGLKSQLIKVVADSAQSYLACLDAYEITEAEAPVGQFRSSGLRALQSVGSGGQAEMAAALLPGIGSDFALRRKGTGEKKKTVIKTTRFAMTSGQQDLVSGMRKPAAKLAKRSKEGSVPAEVEEMIKEALFGPWQYRDDDHSLGWDPQGQRLHALRNKAPTNDPKNRSVSTAIFLATQALPLFPCFVVHGQLRTTGFQREDDEDWFVWPIWRELISLNTLRSLCAQPPNIDLKRRGVEVVYRCRRTRTGGAEGNYQIFSSAEEYERKRRRRGKPNRV